MIQPKIWLIEHQLSAASLERRLGAVHWLREVTDDAVIDLLSRALRDSAPEVRCEAASALGDELDERALPALIEALADQSEAVQVAAIKALKKIGGSAAIAPLVKCFFRGSARVKWSAAQALKALQWKPETAEEKIQWFIANGEFHMLPAFGAAVIKPLKAVLDTLSFEQRVAAVGALESIADPSAEELLVWALSDQHPSVRTAAANALAGFRSPAVTKALGDALIDTESNVREAAAHALGNCGDSSVIEPLIRLLDDKQWQIRTAALEALGKLGDVRACQPIADRLQDQNESVRQSAIEAAGRVGDDAVLDKLVFNLVDDNSNVRGAAARALQQICPDWESSPRVKRLLPTIQAELKNREANTQFAAAGLLRRVGSMETVDLEVAEMALASTVMAAEKRDSGSLPILKELTGDTDNALRFAAELAAAANGQAIRVGASLPAADRPPLAEVVIYSGQRDLIHEWPLGTARQRLRAVDLATQQAQRLTKDLNFGEFQRLEACSDDGRWVIKISENGSALVRIGTLAVPETAHRLATPQSIRPPIPDECVRASVTTWLRAAASVPGIFWRGTRFVDKTIACDMDSHLYSMTAIEQLFAGAAEMFQSLSRPHPVERITFICSRTAIHFARRPDATLFGAFTQAASSQEVQTNLNKAVAEFQGL